MTDEAVTREAMRWAVERAGANRDMLQSGARAWFTGDFRNSAWWLLADVDPARDVSRCPVATIAALLPIAYPEPRGREHWLKRLSNEDARAVRAEMEASR